MKIFWSTVIEPLLAIVNPRVLVQIGCGRGENTRNLIDYCTEHHCDLHVIDPEPRLDAHDLARWQDQCDFDFTLHVGRSLDVLPRLGRVDVAIIDGDHNWYTVYHELLELEKKPAAWPGRFPIALLHDVAWPCGRRDRYHQPTAVPERYRQPIREEGVYPGIHGTTGLQGFHVGRAHATHEGGERNGVQTAIDDFCRVAQTEFDCVRVPIFNGLGILYPRRLESNSSFAQFLAGLDSHVVHGGLAEAIEQDRLKRVIDADRLEKQVQELGRIADRGQQVRTSLEDLNREHALTCSLLTAMNNSWSMKLTSPLRWLQRQLRPPRFDARALIPWQQLEHHGNPGAKGPGLGEWVATGSDPQFLVPCLLPAGWSRLRLQMTPVGPGRLEWYADQEGKFELVGHIEWSEGGPLDREVHFKLPHQSRALRIDPLTMPGQFQLNKLKVDYLPAPRAQWRALVTKIRLLREHGILGQKLLRGLGLLARGRWGEFHQRMLKSLRRPTQRSVVARDRGADYQAWRRQRRLTPSDRKQMEVETAAMLQPPRISVIMPVHDVTERYLRLAIESVRRQTYSNWELCLADDGSTAPHVRRVLEEAGRDDPRIKVVFRGRTGGNAAASNSALELATGSYIALLDHDDELAEHALFRIAQAVTADRSIDYLYTDEDQLDEWGRHVEPRFKPDWSPELCLAFNYTGRLAVYRTELVRGLGGFRSEYEGSQDYDLLLRVTAAAGRVHHIQDILYHSRQLPTTAKTLNKPDEPRTALKALQDHLAATRQLASAEQSSSPGLHRVRFTIRGNPKVSIIIPCPPGKALIAGDSTGDAIACIESVRRQSNWTNLEIILALHKNDFTELLDRNLFRLKAKAVVYGGTFNRAAAMNQGAAAATGSHLIFLNEDARVVTPDWIESLLEFAQQDEIGAVGAKLLAPDGSILHAGIMTPDGQTNSFPDRHAGCDASSVVHRNCSAVSGNCLMTRTDLFRAQGGMRDAFANGLHDLDYCLRLLQTGRRIVYTPHAVLILYSLTPVPQSGPEAESFRQHWRMHSGHEAYDTRHAPSRLPDDRIGADKDRELSAMLAER